jgi:cytochrome c oxidase cbb3-type subunit 3
VRRRARLGAIEVAVTVLVVLVVLAAGACASAPEVPVGPDGTPDAVLEAGRVVFGQRCAACHGSAGQGGRGPKLADGAAAAAYPDIADMVAVIENGKGSGMPSFRDTLEDAERLAVARYVREVL